MSSHKVIFTDYNCFDQLVSSEDDTTRIVVSIDDAVVEEGKRRGFQCRAATNYVNDNESLVQDSDLTKIREWLSNLWEYNGIHIGLTIQNTFLSLFGREFVRQFRLVQSIIKSEDPSSIAVYTDVHPQYKFLEVGESSLYLPVIQSLGSHFEIPVDIEYRYSWNWFADRIFNLIGPNVLRLIDHATERAIAMQDRARFDDAEILIHLANTKNLDVISPVINELNKRNRSILVVAQSHGFFNLKTDNLNKLRGTLPVPVRSYESFQNRSLHRRTKRIPSLLSDRWNSINNDPTFTDQFELDGVPVWKALEEQFYIYFTLQMPRAGKYVETCRQILNEVSPRVVLLKADGPTPTRSMVNVAKSLNIPTVLVQHGLRHPNMNYVPDADHIAAWGEKSAKIFRKKGVTDDRIVITGAPHFDYLNSYDFDISALKNRHSIPDDHAVVTLASQPYSKRVRENLIRSTVEGLESLDGVSLVLRPHPREDVSLHRQYADQTSTNVAVTPNENIHDLLMASNLLFAINSTVILESSILGTPVVLLTFTGEDRHPFYSSENGFPEIANPNNIGPCVSKYLDKQEVLADRQPSFGRRFAFNRDGEAYRRVADLVEDVGSF